MRESFSPKTEKFHVPPVTLMYHHEVEEQWPEKDEFEKTAVNVEFGSQENSEEGPDAVWGFTPEKLKIYMLKGASAVVISSVSESNKFSKGYNACTGLVGIGVDKETGKPLSFLSHADPSCLLGEGSKVSPEEHELILGKLKDRLSELKERCEPGSLSIEVVGGGAGKLPRIEPLYHKSLILLGDLVEKEIGERPIVPVGRNVELGTQTDEMAGEEDLIFAFRKKRDEIKRSDKSEEEKRKAMRAEQQSKNKYKTSTEVYVDTAHLRRTIIRPEQRNPRWNNPMNAPQNHEEFIDLHDQNIGDMDKNYPAQYPPTITAEEEAWWRGRRKGNGGLREE